MKKILVYKETTFTLTLRLNTSAERRVDGEVFHFIDVVSDDNQFVKSFEIKDKHIEEDVAKVETACKEWVDRAVSTATVAKFQSLGFE